MKLRTDQSLIAKWIKNNARVLDLGCGDGALLANLQQEQNVSGYGIEIDEKNIISCLENRVNVIQTDLDAGLSQFDSNTFDYVIMTQTLQAIYYPEKLLTEMTRVGQEAIVTFPNMAHWKCRIQMALGGHMPKSKTLPYEWHNTPNIHLCSLDDFENLCAEKNIKILERTTVDHAHQINLGMSILPNLLGEVAIYRFRSDA